MPDSQARELELWKKRVQLARRVTRRMRQDWIRYLLLYTDGDWEAAFGVPENLEIVPVNKVFSYIRSQLPRLFFKVPKVFTPPIGPDDLLHARTAGDWCNALWQTLPLKRETRLAIIDAMVFGNGFLKVGYNSSEVMEFDDLVQESVDAEAEALQYDLLDAQRQQEGLSLQDVDQSVAPKALRKKDEQVLEYDESIFPDFPWGKRVSPFLMLVDPMATSDNDARWMCHVYHPPLEDAKQVSSWSKAERDRLKAKNIGILEDLFPGGTLDGGGEQETMIKRIFNLVEERGAMGLVSSPLSPLTDKEGTGEDEATLVAQIFEVWDKKTNEVIIFHEDSERPLFRAPNPFKHISDRFPFVHLLLNEVPDSYWGMSDLRPLLPQVRELTRLRSLGLEHVKRCANKKLLLAQGALDEDARDRLEDPGYGIVVETTSPTTRDVVTPADFGNVSPDVYALGSLVKNDFDETAGQGDQQRGVPGTSDTATESAIVERNANIRIADRQDSVLDFLAEFTTKLWKISCSFVRPGKAFQVMGPKAGSWHLLKSEALRPEREMRVEVGSTIRQDDEIRKRRIIETLNVAAPFILNGLVPLNVVELFRQFLEAQEFPDPQAILQVSQDQAQSQLSFLQQFSQARAGGPEGDSNVATNQAANAGQAGGVESLLGLGDLLRSENNFSGNAGSGF